MKTPREAPLRNEGGGLIPAGKLSPGAKAAWKRASITEEILTARQARDIARDPERLAFRCKRLENSGREKLHLGRWMTIEKWGKDRFLITYPSAILRRPVKMMVDRGGYGSF